MIKATTSKFASLRFEYENEKKKSKLKHFHTLEKQSSFKLSNGPATAAIKRVYGQFTDYDTLMVTSVHNLTKWMIEEENSNATPYQLERLTMYPCIITSTGQMAFARIARTRISYLRTRLKWTAQPHKICNQPLDVYIYFPDEELDKHNIVIDFTAQRYGTIKAYFLFTGDTFELIKTDTVHWGNTDRHMEITSNLESKFFSKQSALDAFFKRYFTHFTYKSLGITNANVKEYLKGEHYRISAIEYKSTPVLIIEPTD